METKIILCGLGGQGVVFLTRLLAKTAIANGLPVMVSETHGMSQRGGSVISHLKISGNQAPLIPHGTADILIALETDEAVRNLPYLRSGGTAFVNAKNGLRSEVAGEVSRLALDIHCVPASQLAIELGAAAVANVVLAGFAAAHPKMPLSFETLQETLKNISKRGLELNLIALETGYHAKKEQETKV
ncbi:MAG TPA: 2-oxoacid:acceptor oxidoreductase family protein [Anaerolineales bacterium]|nr:2-oxoacid:acceptor oxidoreductase family protein [Anaerolineales bacterium]